jgi:transposase
MPAPYSLDLRKKALEAYENGEGSQSEIAERFSISQSTLKLWIRLKSHTGKLNPKPHIYRGRKRIIDEKGLEFLSQLIESKPDLLIEEMRVGYQEKNGVLVSASMICRSLKDLDLRRKKKVNMRKNKIEKMYKKKE